MTRTSTRDDEGEYRVEQYDPSDRSDVLALDEVVWDRSRSESWFAWKYEENPYVSDVPVFLARADGRVVGARPLMGFRLRRGEAIVTALQPSDTMVHPSYRGQGIFTAMTEAALEHYADRSPVLCFNFPNEQAWPGYQSMGWRSVDRRTTHYRVQDVAALATTSLEAGLARRTVRAAAPIVQSVRTAWTDHGQPADGLVLETEPGVPDDLLAGLYLQEVPERIHVPRDREFYRWRLRSPAWRRRTFVATRDDRRVAAVVARTRTTTSGLTVTQLVDVVPLAGGDGWEAALGFLLGKILEAHTDSDLVVAADAPIPTDLLRSYGFLPDDAPPLSWFTPREPTFAVRPLGDSADAWELNGYRIDDPSSWLLSIAGRDTA